MLLISASVALPFVPPVASSPRCPQPFLVSPRCDYQDPFPCSLLHESVTKERPMFPTARPNLTLHRSIASEHCIGALQHCRLLMVVAVHFSISAVYQITNTAKPQPLCRRVEQGHFASRLEPVGARNGPIGGVRDLKRWKVCLETMGSGAV